MHRYATLRHGLIGAWCPSLVGASSLYVPDRSSFNRAATLNGSLLAGAVYVNGGSNQLTMPATTSVVAGDFAVTFWLWLHAYNGGYCTLVDKGVGGPGREFSVFFNTSGNISAINIGYQSLPAGQAIGLTTGQWQHVAFVRSATTMTFWRNGALRATSTGVSGTTTNAGAWSFGQNPSGGGTLPNASYDDVRFYKRALSGSEVGVLSTARGVGLLPTRRRRAQVLGSQFWLRDAGTWKKATGWIKVGGVWTKATPKLNVTGAWK